MEKNNLQEQEMNDGSQNVVESENVYVESENTYGSKNAKTKLLIRKIFIIFSVSAFFCGMALMLLLPGKAWIGLTVIFSSSGLLVLFFAIEGVISIARFFRKPKETIEPIKDATVGILAELGKGSKSSYKSASKKDKLKFWLTSVPFILSFICMVLGVFFANNSSSLKTVGFILMAIAGGVTAIWIVVLIIISKIRKS